jgi:hypothetical protein
MLCLLKTSRDLQKLFAAVTHQVEGLSLETLLTLKDGEVSDLLIGYTETKTVHNRTTANFVLEHVDKK